MKKTILTLTMLALATIADALPVSYVNLTTLSTNVSAVTGAISVPGVMTNAPYTAVNTNTAIGDSFYTAFNKMNGNIFYLYNFLLTNSFGGGGSGSATNAIAKSFGVGNDTTITNTITLINTNLYWTTTLLDVMGFSNTNCPGGYFPTDNYLAVLTNNCGYTVWNAHITTCTNVAGPYTLCNTYEIPVLTNACGFMVLTNYSTTNDSGPYLLVTNLGPDVYVNFFGYVVMGNVCPNQNGPYYPALLMGLGVMTNFCGDVIKVGVAYSNNTYAVSSITVANGDLGAGTYTPLDASRYIFTCYNPTFPAYESWAYFTSNDWHFFSATNVAFSSLPSETITINGTIESTFYVTNCPILPDTNTVYQSSISPYNTVQFGEDVVGGYYIDVNGNMFGWGSIPPAASSLTIIIFPPGTTVTNYPPATNSPPVAPSCNGNYITVTLGGVRKFLIHGESWYEQAHNSNQQTGQYTSYLSVGTDGYAAFYLFGARVQEAYWTDSSQWTTSIPPDACPGDWPLPFSIY